MATATDIMAEQQELLFASHDGRIADVMRLVEQEGVDINCRDGHGVPALYFASQNGHFSTVQFLVEKKADMTLTTNEGFSPLMIASQKGHVKIMEVLLKAGANMGHQNIQGITALHLAVVHSQIEAAEVLIDYGADLLVENDEGQTSLDMAKTEEVKAHLRMYKEVHRLRQEVLLNKNLTLVTAFGNISSSSSTHNNNNDDVTTTNYKLLDQVIAENAQLRHDQDAKNKQLDEMTMKLNAVIQENARFRLEHDALSTTSN